MLPLPSVLNGDAARYSLAVVTARRARGTTRPAGMILLHHDVAAASDDPRRSLTPAIAVDLLREQLTHLARHYRVVSLAELDSLMTEPQRAGPLPVALTFDDDLTSHHGIVAPLLAELGFPATFFLTGAMLDGPSSFWWHDLQQLFRAGGAYWASVTDELTALWGEPRVPVTLGWVAKTMQAAPATVRDRLKARMRELAEGLATDNGLDAPAVRDLVAGGFEIGFHTNAHHHLQFLNGTELNAAMRDGRKRLEETIERPLIRIAYPFGAADLRVAGAAAAAGFERGYTVEPVPVQPGVDPLLIPRVDARTSPGRLALMLARLTTSGA